MVLISFFDKHSASHFAVGRFLLSASIYRLSYFFLWKKWSTFSRTTMGWGFCSFSHEKLQGSLPIFGDYNDYNDYPVIAGASVGSKAWFLIVKTELVNFTVHLCAFFCSSPWVNAGGASGWCFSEEQPSGVRQRRCLFLVLYWTSCSPYNLSCITLPMCAEASSIQSRAEEPQPLQKGQSVALPFASLLLFNTLKLAWRGGLVCLRKDPLCWFGRWPRVGVIQLFQLSPSTHLPFLTAGENGLL